MTTRKLIKYYRRFNNHFWARAVIEHVEIMQGYTIRTVFQSLEIALFEPEDLEEHNIFPGFLEELHGIEERHGILETVTIADALLIE